MIFKAMSRYLQRALCFHKVYFHLLDAQKNFISKYVSAIPAQLSRLSNEKEISCSGKKQGRQGRYLFTKRERDILLLSFLLRKEEKHRKTIPTGTGTKYRALAKCVNICIFVRMIRIASVPVTEIGNQYLSPFLRCRDQAGFACGTE